MLNEHETQSCLGNGDRHAQSLRIHWRKFRQMARDINSVGPRRRAGCCLARRCPDSWGGAHVLVGSLADRRADQQSALRYADRSDSAQIKTGVAGACARSSGGHDPNQESRVVVGACSGRAARRIRGHVQAHLGEPFDFVTWFEFGRDDKQAFDDLVGLLRATPEWEFVEREVEIRLELQTQR
jgi:hypothetical protein